MSDMQAYLAERQAKAESAASLAERDRAARAWLWGDRTPEHRLAAFDRWVRLELEARLDWTWAGAAKSKRIEQCRLELERLMKDLAARGWLLDGRRLAGLITDALDDVAGAQRKGQVRDFWPYFRACVGRYVGANAEEIREDAMSLGTHVGQVFEALARDAKRKGPTLPELVAQRAGETLRERLARQRRREALKKAEAAQRQLF